MDPPELMFETAVIASPFSGGDVRYERQGAKWSAQIGWDTTTGVKARAMTGWRAGLYGALGRVLLPLWHYPGPVGTITGTVTATGAANSKTVALAGMTGTLLIGDMIEIAERLYVITADGTASAGALTASIAPPLRAACSAAAVRYSVASPPRCLMSLADERQRWFSFRPPDFASGSIDWLEPLP